MKNRIRTYIARLAVVITAMLPMAEPAIVYAQAQPDPVCICEDKCTEDEKKDDCEVCAVDIRLCDGVEPEIPDGPLTPDGNLTLVDDYGSGKKAGKQFITVVTKTGNYFYLIIDRDDEGEETVHFLNMVDEADLLKLMDEEEVKKYTDAVAAVESEKEQAVQEVPATPSDVQPVAPVEPDKEKPEGRSQFNWILIAMLAVGACGVAGYIFAKKSKMKPKKSNVIDPDLDYDENEDFLANLDEEEELYDETEETESAEDEEE